MYSLGVLRHCVPPKLADEQSADGAEAGVLPAALLDERGGLSRNRMRTAFEKGERGVETVRRGEPKP